MIWPSYLSAFLSLATLGLAFFCWRRRHLAVAPPLALLCFCLALVLAFEVTNPSTHQPLDPVLVRDKLIFWNSTGQIAETAVIYSILWLVLRWRPLPWLASRQHLLTVGLALFFLTFAYLCLFRLELLVGSIDYRLGSKLSLAQLTTLGRCWAFFGGLIQLTSMSWLLLNCFQPPSSLQQQQARWLLLALFIPMILPFFSFCPHSHNHPLSPTSAPGCWLNAVPNGLGAVSRRSASPPALLLEYCLSTHANRRPSAR